MMDKIKEIKMKKDHIMLGIFIVIMSGILIVLAFNGCAKQPLLRLDNGFERTVGNR